jgi:hypothetical protein
MNRSLSNFGLCAFLAAVSLVFVPVAHAGIITSADFSFGFGAYNSTGNAWNTAETSTNNTPTTQGNFTFTPTVTGPVDTSTGPTFIGRVLGTGYAGAVCGWEGTTTPWTATIVASWTGPTPLDAAPNPNYQLMLEITQISIYGLKWNNNPTQTLKFHESTPGNVGDSPILNLKDCDNAFSYVIYPYNWNHLVWDPNDVAVAGTTSTRTFGLVASPVEAALEGFEVFGRVHLLYDTVPEPSTFVLLLCGAAGLLCYAWRKRR